MDVVSESGLLLHGGEFAEVLVCNRVDVDVDAIHRRRGIVEIGPGASIDDVVQVGERAAATCRLIIVVAAAEANLIGACAVLHQFCFSATGIDVITGTENHIVDRSGVRHFVVAGTGLQTGDAAGICDDVVAVSKSHRKKLRGIVQRVVA